MTNSENYETMAQFVRQISRFTQDSECQTCAQPGADENPSCPEHEPWNMPVDDAINTVDGLISRARQLVIELNL